MDSATAAAAALPGARTSRGGRGARPVLEAVTDLLRSGGATEAEVRADLRARGFALPRVSQLLRGARAALAHAADAADALSPEPGASTALAEASLPEAAAAEPAGGAEPTAPGGGPSAAAAAPARVAASSTSSSTTSSPSTPRAAAAAAGDADMLHIDAAVRAVGDSDVDIDVFGGSAGSDDDVEQDAASDDALRSDTDSIAVGVAIEDGMDNEHVRALIMQIVAKPASTRTTRANEHCDSQIATRH